MELNAESQYVIIQSEWAFNLVAKLRSSNHIKVCHSMRIRQELEKNWNARKVSQVGFIVRRAQIYHCG